MNPMLALANRLRTFDADTNVTLRLIIEDGTVNAYIIDSNAEEQLFQQGIYADGQSIMDFRPYSPLTIEYKKEKGQPYDRVTLRDEGDFESSFFVETTAEGFSIKASDWKTEELTIKYGDEILGLTDKNLHELIWEYVFPLLMKALRKTIFQHE